MGDEVLLQLILLLMSIQLLLGYPVCSIALKKGMKIRMAEGTLPMSIPTDTSKSTTPVKKKLFTIPDHLKSFYFIFTMLGIVGYVSITLAGWTGLSQYAFYILLGFAFSELGLLDNNCLVKSGGAGLQFGTMYAVVLSSFATMNLLDLINILPNTVILLAFGVIGCLVATVILKSILKNELLGNICNCDGLYGWISTKC